MKDTEDIAIIDENKSGSQDDSKESNEKELSRWDKFNEFRGKHADTNLGRFGKFLISFSIAFGIRYAVNSIWFNHSVYFSDPEYDFYVKLATIFIGSGGFLFVLDSAMKSKGHTTALALGLFLFVNIAQHYVKQYYNPNGESKVFINVHKGYVYTEEYAGDIAEIKVAGNGKKYFIHPVSGDTCWNDDVRKINIMKPNNTSYYNSDYNPPTRTVVYTVEGSPYTFKLKSGETLDHWIAFAAKNMHISLDAENYDYWMIYSSSEKYHSAPDVVPPDRDYARFYLKAGDRDQIIKMTLSYN